MSTSTANRQIVTVLLVLIGALLVVPALFMGFGMMGFGPMMGGGMWGYGMQNGGGSIPGWVFVAGLLVQLLFLAALVGAGYLIFRTLVGRTDGRDPAVEELRRAYARGDLSEEEFESRRRTLEDGD